MRFHRVAKAGLELLSSSNPPASVSSKCWDCRHEPPCLAINPVKLTRKINNHNTGWSVMVQSRLTATSASQVQHFGRSRQADHLRTGVRDQPDKHGETPSLLKIQKVDSEKLCAHYP
ncbi:hypothetical protein AAY473_023866 [Plecturocebus cupreus]